MQTFLLVLLPFITCSCLDYTKKNTLLEENIIVRIETTYGDIDIKLYNETPTHRDNFVKLINEGFYDDLLFHRVIENFMIQGGDPNSRGADKDTRLGSGGPGYTIPSEINDNLFHKKGALAAARQGDNVNPERESSGSQFYIVQGTVFSPEHLSQMEAQINDQREQMRMSQVFRTLEKEYISNNEEPDYRKISEEAPAIVEEKLKDSGLFEFSDEQKEIYTTTGGIPHLDGAYTVFGETISGFDVIDEIASKETSNADRPLTDIIMKIKILPH